VSARCRRWTILATSMCRKELTKVCGLLPDQLYVLLNLFPCHIIQHQWTWSKLNIVQPLSFQVSLCTFCANERLSRSSFSCCFRASICVWSRVFCWDVWWSRLSRSVSPSLWSLFICSWYFCSNSLQWTVHNFGPLLYGEQIVASAYATSNEQLVFLLHLSTTNNYFCILLLHFSMVNR